ncbi:ABC transporter permease subunit [Kutzneria buriramensis]|uniref:ABC-2 type transport system permease protein n=1 Tax=Kutzneria buriramensis TaxID=1045776 RepID=A0A3E0IAX4_9PSEU|nr:ABC transporter permease subunit [Kutzneria buriramensis]REH55884.1 ABC-2 type transport system permease protein [Kutzneria buriramensis]
MGRLISAEFRKILTTKMWWALLIPTVALAALWSIGGNALVGAIVDQTDQSEIAGAVKANVSNLPWSTLIFARTVNISALFPIVFGALAVSSEINRRTITTSYLTAPNRGTLLGAKLITYAIWGLAFGVVITGVDSIGMAIASHPEQLPDAVSWLEIAGTGILSCMLWTLLAMGIGALFGSPIAAIISLLLYTLLVENLIGLVLPDNWPGILINGSADGLTGSVAAQLIVDKVSTISPYFNQEAQDAASNIARTLAGARGAFDWWISGLIFAAWTAAFVVGGWFMSKQRDIT